jgi:YggT family protein
VLLSILARVASAAVSIYMLLCIIRVFMSWAPGLPGGRAGELLGDLADPWLGVFSRSRFLKVGAMDFSPVAAIAILAVLNNVLMTLAFAGKISLGVVLGMLVGAVWSAVGFVLAFFSVCALLRLIAYAAHWNSLHPLWRTIDALLNPLLYRINRLLYRDRIVNYLQGLITGFAVFVIIWKAGGLLAGLVSRLLDKLPF